jgi:flavin reductase (DIM6/NTAB) family NADH-FMN oxidoreductase RutF
MVRRIYQPTDARRLLTPGPVGIVTTAWRGNTNAAPITWMTTLSMEPPLVGIVVHPDRHTADMVRLGEEFAINIPGPSLLKQTAFLASQSGLNINKLEAAGVEVFRGQWTEAPLIEGCLAWIECGVEDMQRYGDHLLFVGRVMKVQALEEAYAEHWLLQDRENSPLAYLGGDRYAVISEPLQATFETNLQGALIAETVEEREEREEREGQERDKKRAEGEEGFVQMLERERDDIHKTVF